MKKHLKVNRSYSWVKKVSWLLIPIIAVGGLFVPKLGLLLAPIMLSLLILGFFKGKYWCGNICPHGSLFDHVLLPVAPVKKIPAIFRSFPLKAGFFLFFVTMLSLRMVRISSFWGSLDYLDKLGTVLAMNYLMPTIIGVILALLVNPRAWCNFCPMGVMQTISYRLGKLTGLNKLTNQNITISDLDKCRSCGKCSMVCPMQLEVHKGFNSDNEFDNDACLKCTVCVKNCPLGLLSLGKAPENQRMDQQEIAS